MKEIPLTRGLVATVDDEDFAIARYFKWHALPSGYAVAAIKLPDGKRDWIYLHRLLFGFPEGLQVDHINGNKQDNRRDNLRLCTHAQNKHNTGRYANNSSGFKGVGFSKRNKKWRARISKNGKQFELGYFDNPEEAYSAYCKAARNVHGDFSNVG